jgi:hypothetical protein
LKKISKGKTQVGRDTVPWLGDCFITCETFQLVSSEDKMKKNWSSVAAVVAFTFALVLSSCSSSEKVAEQPAPAEQQQPTTVSQNDNLNLGAASAGRAH